MEQDGNIYMYSVNGMNVEPSHNFIYNFLTGEIRFYVLLNIRIQLDLPSFGFGFEFFWFYFLSILFLLFSLYFTC